MLRVVAHLISKEDRTEETREILLGLIEPTRAEAGCIMYELHQNAADPTDLTFIEEWTDDAALDAHLQTTHIAGAIDKLRELLAAPPDIRRYRLVQ
ncbi:MAG TPA: putative quinol monooxygenase [Pyrinomonadaceae bacterium]|nr:putative quinol monooxygenase [Pyrinomonadaceae bacterium]HMP65426.1 putative quinol monooxygenase [Pyrinomonadaceae bacterium]